MLFYFVYVPAPVSYTHLIIENFEKHTAESGNPLFEFCVTIQNHGPYGEKYTDLARNFASNTSLTGDEEAIYSGYFEGIDDADKQIEDLVNYFSNSDEPVVLVFFGDHLPGFSNGMTYFDQFRPVSYTHLVTITEPGSSQ